MAALARFRWELEVLGSDGVRGISDDQEYRWSPGTAGDGKQETLSLTLSASTTVTVPSGATFALIQMGANVSLTLKGVSGDTGIVLQPATNPKRLPLILPLSGSVASFVFTSGSASAQTVKIYWL